MPESILPVAYKDWLHEIKSKVRVSQIKAALAVNTALIDFYWDLGKMIFEKLETEQWGNKVIEQLAFDLKQEFSEMKGFSRANLYFVKSFYQKYYEKNEIVQQLVRQLPWGHNILIFSKLKCVSDCEFYLKQAIENDWSRNVLALQIKSQLHERQGKAISNFSQTLPEPFSELAQQTLKDPYVFDFLSLTTDANERAIELQLIEHISKFLLELGKGFAFVGRQYHVEIAEQHYYIDLLFYHIPLKCYVVVELKNTRFIPEYTGKLNFYLSVIDDTLKGDDDKPTIGILLCRDKNNIEVEYALRGLNRPLGVSEFNFTEVLPEEYKSVLPSIEEIEQEFNKM